MTELALVEPENSLGTENGGGELVIEKVLELAQGKGAFAAKRQGSESFDGLVIRVLAVVVLAVVVAVVIVAVVIVAVAVVVMAMVVVVSMGLAFLMNAMAVVMVTIVMLLLRRHPVTFKQANAEQQRQRHLPFDAAENAGIRLDLTQLAFELLQSLLTDKVALIKQKHVSINDLGAGHLPLE